MIKNIDKVTRAPGKLTVYMVMRYKRFNEGLDHVVFYTDSVPLDKFHPDFDIAITIRLNWNKPLPADVLIPTFTEFNIKEVIHALADEEPFKAVLAHAGIHFDPYRYFHEESPKTVETLLRLGAVHGGVEFKND